MLDTVDRAPIRCGRNVVVFSGMRSGSTSTRARIVVGCGLLICLACAIPTTALAATLSAKTLSVEVLGHGSESATVIGTVETGEAGTNAYAAYGPLGGQWCTSGGREGTPSQTSLGGLPEWEGEHMEARIPIKGLEPETEYCAEIVATNEEATAYGGQLDFKTLVRGAFKTIEEELPLPAHHFNPYRGPEGNIAQFLERERESHEQSERERREREAREAGEREAREASGERQALAARCLVPHLHGQSLNRARRVLASSHCKLGHVTHFSTHRGVVVVAQTIPAGHETPEGTAVGVRLGRITNRTASHTPTHASPRSIA